MVSGQPMWALKVLAWLCGAWLLLLSPVPAVADASDEARILFEAGVTASRAGRWREASEYFQRSLSLAEKPSTWFNLAVAEVKLGNGRAALRSLDAFEQIATPNDHAEMLQRATQLRADAEALRAAEPEPAPSPAEAAQTAEPVPEAAPVFAPTHQRPAARPPASDSGAALRAPRRLLVAGVGLALATAGTLIWWGDRADARDRCDQDPTRCTNTDRLEREERTALGVSVALGTVSAGLIVAGATWLAREKRQAAKTTAHVVLGRQAASFSVRAIF
jgi:hypothetical protein